jgi:hypothetical protein
MLEPEERERLKRGMLSIKVLWGASLSSLVIYAIICHVISNSWEDIGFDDFTLWLIRGTLAFIALVCLVVAHFSRKFMLSIPPKGSKRSPIQKILILSVQPLAYIQHQAAAKYMTATILSVAFSVSVGIFGLILFLISGEFITFYIFVIAATIALYFFRPRFEELEQLAIDLKRQRDSG